MKVLEDLEKNITFKQYKVIITPRAEQDRDRIYDYIAYILYNMNAADKLIDLIENELSRLEYSPYLYPEIEKMDDLKRRYRRIVVKNYIILYIVEQNDNVVYISHICNGRMNYIKNNY